MLGCKKVVKLMFLYFVYLVGYYSTAHAMEEVAGSIPRELRNLPYGVYPDSPEYNTDRLNYNKRFQYFPKAIFYPREFEEIQYVLSILKRKRLEFATRSGGHCLEPGSLSSNYIIDLSRFDQIRPDFKKKEVCVGAGVRTGDLIAKLGRSDHAIPTGTCPSTGITGVTLGGGIGLLDRDVGLTCDVVKSITFLDANAEIIEVDRDHNEDLFWALRGGGNGSYGIVLGWTFHMSYIPNASFYELIWEFEPALIAPIIHTWQDWIKEMPPNISSVLAIRHSNDLCAEPEDTPPIVIRIFGLKIGREPFTEWEAFKRLKPQVKIFKGGYGELSKLWATESNLPFFKGKSRILQQPIGDSTISLITEFFEMLENRDPSFLIYFELEAFGGAMREKDTAFFPRRAFGWWEQAYYWPRQEQSPEVLALSREFYAKIPNEVSKFCYANFVDYDLGERYLHDYYGDHVDRLIRIKRKYDPTDLFHWHQSIPLKNPERVRCTRE